MMGEVVVLIAGPLAAGGISFGFGRWLGGRWIVIFLVLMAIVAGLVIISAMNATGGQAGMAEVLLLIFIWAPVLVCGLIGGIIGWVRRSYAERPVAPPPVP